MTTFETLILSRQVVDDAFMYISQLDKFDPLRNQASRSAISVVSNIAEGNQRRGKDRKQLFLVAKGSLSELYEQLRIMNVLCHSKNLEPNIDRLHGMLYELIQKSESQSASVSEVQ